MLIEEGGGGLGNFADYVRFFGLLFKGQGGFFLILFSANRSVFAVYEDLQI